MLVNFLITKDIAEIKRICFTYDNIYFLSFDDVTYQLYDEPRPDKFQEVEDMWNSVKKQLRENPNGMVEVEI